MLDAYLNENIYLANRVLKGHRKGKRQKMIHLTPVTFGLLNYRLGKPKYTNIKILFDSGASKSIIKSD